MRAGLHGLLTNWAGVSRQVTAPSLMTKVVINDVAYMLYCEPWNADAELETLLAGLSPRELQVARLVGQGFTAKAIAKELNLKRYTVDTYIRRVYSKLNIHSRTALIQALARRPL